MWVALGAIPIGALGILMITYLVRRAWTVALHPVLVAANATLPVVALLFIPILLWLANIYPAAHDAASLPAFKAFYLARWFFAFRALVYFAIWSWLAIWLRDAWNDNERMTRAASAGFLIYALTLSLAGVDWLESLEPDFHSSVYGLLFLSATLLNGFAFALGGALLLRRRVGALTGYAAMLMSLILFWAYLHAMQYIVIWSANIPDEVTWYLKRSTKGWQFVLIALAFGQLLFPFFALLSERIRGNRRWLGGLCGLTLAMRCCEAAILTLPAIPDIAPFTTSVMLVAALVFIAAALWMAFSAALARGGRWITISAWRVHAETESKQAERLR